MPCCFNGIFHSDKQREILSVFAMVFHSQEDSCCSLQEELNLIQHFSSLLVPATYSLGTRSSFPGGKVAEA